ncbi:MAG: ATP-binding cassette domain-containing protein, partial [Eubacteriales bacterium]
MSTEIVNINKTFRKKEVLRGISFSAERGTCTGIIGRNGSGKSTLLSILAGVQRCDSGDLIFEGKSLFSDRKALSSTVGYVPQGTPLIEELSAYDNLLLWYDRDELTKELQSGVLFMLGINEFLKTPVFKMSGGMKKRLSIGCSVFRKPPVLLLDE